MVKFETAGGSEKILRVEWDSFGTKRIITDYAFLVVIDYVVTSTKSCHVWFHLSTPYPTSCIKITKVFRVVAQGPTKTMVTMVHSIAILQCINILWSKPKPPGDRDGNFELQPTSRSYHCYCVLISGCTNFSQKLYNIEMALLRCNHRGRCTMVICVIVGCPNFCQITHYVCGQGWCFLRRLRAGVFCVGSSVFFATAPGVYCTGNRCFLRRWCFLRW